MTVDKFFLLVLATVFVFSSCDESNRATAKNKTESQE